MLFSLNRPVCLLLAFGLGQALCQAEFVQDIKPLLERYCFKCHGNKRAKAEVNLEAFGTRPDFSRDGRTWGEGPPRAAPAGDAAGEEAAANRG